MLTPEYLDGVAEEVQKIYAELESAIMQDMARRIARGSAALTSATEWQIYKLQALGASQEYIAQQIAKTLKVSERAVYDMFKAAGIKSIRTDVRTQKAAIEAGLLPSDTIPLAASASVAQVLNVNAARTLNTMKRLTGTRALDTSGALNRYMDQCQLMVQSGAFTPEQAVEHTVRKFAADGIQAFDYASGVRTTIEAAVRRACVTGVNQATAEVSLNNATVLNTDLVEVTSHADARPSHAVWQGGVYKLHGSTAKYRNLADTTGYGTGAGLCGWNCRHSFYAYVEGVSDRLPKEQYDQDTYEAEQTQRYYERQIRKWKKKAATLEAGGVDSSSERSRIAFWQARQRKHLADTDLTRDYARERAYSSKR